MKTNNMYYAKGIKFTEGRMPILVLTNSEKNIYLSPFRGYKFQVSNSFDGDWDLGSSRVVGLGNIISETLRMKGGVYSSNLSKVNTEKYIFELMAKEAIEEAMRHPEIKGTIDRALFKEYTSSGQNKLFREFIDLTYDYILHLM